MTDAAQPAHANTDPRGVGFAGCWQPPSVAHLQDVLAHYEVLDFLGRGGMGAVYKARQRSLNREVAIKILPPSARHSGIDFVERFKLEARAMARLNHPAIVAVHDFGESAEGQLFIVMELIEGGDLAGKIEKEGRLPISEALRIADRVCEALEYAHSRGVVHRDIKPANILVARDGTIKVTDFGLAKLEDPLLTNALTHSNTTLGSQDFAAPEVFAKGKDADHRADIYSLGVMLYQMLTGDVPRGMFKMPSEKLPGLDSRLDALICKAMEEDRADRYQSAMEMREALSALQSPLAPDGLCSVPGGEQVRAMSDRRRRHWISLAVVGGALAAMVCGVIAGLRTAKPSLMRKESAAVVAPQASQDEIRSLAQWVLGLPGVFDQSSKVTRKGEVHLKGMQAVGPRAVLPAGPLVIMRLEIPLLRVDDTAKHYLDILARLEGIKELMFFAVADPVVLTYLRDLRSLTGLRFNAPDRNSQPMQETLLSNLALLSELSSLNLEGWPGFTGEGLAALSSHRKLTALVLDDSRALTDRGLASVARLSGIKVLSLNRCSGFSDAGLAQLVAMKNLAELTVDGDDKGRFTGVGLAELRVLPRLHVLRLGRTFPGSGLKHVGNLTHLDRLYLTDNHMFNDTDLPQLAPLTNLVLLRLDDTVITGTGFADVTGMTKPLNLHVEDCPLTDDGIRAIARALPNLEALTISRNQPSFATASMGEALRNLPNLRRVYLTHKFADVDLPSIATLTQLRGLSLELSDVTDAGIPHLQALPNLTDLTLTGLKLTDACIPALKELRGLKVLNLSGTQITPGGLADIKRALPACKVMP